MYVVVGENWWYHKGIGTQRQAETAAVRAAHGGKDILTGEDRAAASGNPPDGLIARLIASSPAHPDGPNLVLWVWESKEHALAAGGAAAALAKPDLDEVRSRVSHWMDWSQATINEYEVIYFAHCEESSVS